ncbi:MAG: prepilin peptidase [Phycisphaerales bacterium]
MEQYEVLLIGLKVIWGFFVFALGACIGSLTNVIVYRTPLGISIVTPPSRCPKCDTRLGLRDNIPIFGWLFLRGRCRYCKNPISPEYPIVELCVALLFTLFYIVWYVLPPNFTFVGVQWGAMRPVWAMNDATQTWPTFVVFLTLLGALVAMTIVDAKTFTIPLRVMWVPPIVAVLVHPIHAALISPPYRAAGDWHWAIPTPDRTNWPLVWASIGAILGLGLANLLLHFKFIRRSFADYADWEQQHLAAAAPDTVVTAGAPGSAGTPELWMVYPHARREMVLELAFLGPCLGLGLLGWYFGQWWATPPPPTAPGVLSLVSVAPLWLTVLSGVLLGYLIGGGLVWAVRILGSLGFGKEAMGLGDVHLMAAVGASVGYINSSLAFFGAAFVGLAWTILALASRGKVRRMMPYGPFLAVATVMVLLARPLIEQGLSVMLRHPVQIP